MLAYKGFEKGLMCRGYQFDSVEWNETDAANCRSNGFHCAENPLDCLSYYPDVKSSMYCLCEAEGDIDEDAYDSKISCTKLKIVKQLSVRELVIHSILYAIDHPATEKNHRFIKDYGIAKKDFVIVYGRNPVAKGLQGTVLGFLKEDGKGLPVDMNCLTIDGDGCLPDIWYNINGEGVDHIEEKRIVGY